jgi:hypothetical protein
MGTAAHPWALFASRPEWDQLSRLRESRGEVLRVRKRPSSMGCSCAGTGLISRGAEAPKAYGRDPGYQCPQYDDCSEPLAVSLFDHRTFRHRIVNSPCKMTLFMMNQQKASIRPLHFRQKYRSQNSEFAFRAFDFSAIYPNPSGWPATATTIRHQ